MANPLLLSVTEVQEATHLGRTTIYALIRQGKLPIVRIGRSVRVRRETLERWLRELEDTSENDLPAC